MCAEMPLKGLKVLLVPLEMTKSEMTSRLIAQRSGLDVTKIVTGRLATGEKELAYRKYVKWAKKVKKLGGRLTIFKPDGDMTFEEVLAATNTYDCDARIFDYISLFKGVDGDDSWQQLGSIARQAKIHAGATNSTNILLCQVNEDGKVRYARAISEHANNSFIWVTKKEEREKEVGRITVEQPKARNSKSFPFDVGFKWANMKIVKVEDVTSDVGDVATPKKNLADL
jgi:replicative DNA helicase